MLIGKLLLFLVFLCANGFCFTKMLKKSHNLDITQQTLKVIRAKRKIVRKFLR